MNCVTYARVSTQEQAERELSLPAQQQAMREYAKRQGWVVVGEFVERGVSARTAERPVLRELIARCKQEPKVDVVLVHKIDRLARNVYDHATIRLTLKRCSVKLASVVENVDDTVSGQLLENIMASISQFYSENLAEEVKKGMRMLVTRGGWPHKPPRGYAIVRDAEGRGRVVVDAATGATVRRMFELYSTGEWSLRDLRRDLAKLGIRSPSGQALPIQSVRDMLQNSFYAGRVRWHEAEYEGSHEALISPELFAKVQATLERRRKDYGERGRLHFWLRGVATCSDCGARMTAERHGTLSYYRCVRNTRSSDECRARFTNTEPAHTAVHRLLRTLTVPAQLRTEIMRVAEEILGERRNAGRRRMQSLQVRRAKLEEQEQRLTAAFAAGDVSLAAYRATVANLRDQLAACQHALMSVKSDPGAQLEKLRKVVFFADSLWEYHAKLEGKAQTQLLRLVFKAISLDSRGVVGYSLYAPFDRLLAEDTGDHSGGGHARDLELTKVKSTIVDIFEFDSSVLRALGSVGSTQQEAA